MHRARWRRGSTNGCGFVCAAAGRRAFIAASLGRFVFAKRKGAALDARASVLISSLHRGVCHRAGKGFRSASAVGCQITEGATRVEKLNDWICPICSQPLILNPYPSGRGFKLLCKGADGAPHELRIYLSGFRKDASFLPSKVSGVEHSRKSRALLLLDRVKEHAAKGESANGQSSEAR
jgi:hypothetical protein